MRLDFIPILQIRNPNYSQNLIIKSLTGVCMADYIIYCNY